MSGYEGSHQDWLEGQASDQLEREGFGPPRAEERTHSPSGMCLDFGCDGDLFTPCEHAPGVMLVPATDGKAEFAHGDGWLGITLRQGGHRIASFSMDHDIAVNFAHAILAEVEIAQRDEDAEERTEAGFVVCEFCHRGYLPEDGPHLCG